MRRAGRRSGRVEPMSGDGREPVTANRWLVLVAMTGSLSMIMLDQTVVTVALPVMSDDLGLAPTGQQWVVNAYVLALTALVAFGGKLGDRVGGVRTFRLGVAGFFIASALCGLAPAGGFGEAWIIAARALQGAAAALMVPTSGAIVISAFPAQERGRAMAAYVGISQIFLAIGPLIGGVLTESVSWRAVFWLNVPVGVAALVLVAIAKPAQVTRPGRIRPGALALLVGGLGASVLAVQQAATWGWDAPLTLLLLVGGVAAIATFVVTQSRVPDPLVDVRLLRRGPFLGNVVVNGLIQFGLLAAVLHSSLYLQDLLHFSPLTTGLAVLAMVLPITVAAQLGGRWFDRSGVRPPALAGLVISTVGMLAWTLALPYLSYPLQVPGMVLTGFGLGLTMSPTNTDALSRVAAEQRSQASGVLQTIRQLGGTLGVAVVGAVVLGIEHRGTQGSDTQAAADAIAVGFAVSTAAFAVALLAAARLLARERVAADSSAAADAVA
jgi:EmrB/QacA subfamily drug resistance transporter